MDNNINLNKMLETLRQMDKSELESKLKQAQEILKSKNIDKNNLTK